MYTGGYKDDVVDVFNGIFQRGSIQNTPKDHASDSLNCVFGTSGSVETRGAIQSSYNPGHTPVRQFLSTINNSYKLLTCDGAGNIYANGSIIYSAANIVDFSALNIFNKTFIAPIYSVAASSNVLLIYDGTTCRQAGGNAPTSSFSATEPSTGSVDAGIHKIAVCFVTPSGFTTPPGPKIAGVFTPVTITSSGGKNIHLSGIPTGPAGTTARIILVTKADLNVYYYVNGGTINDNVTTVLDLDFLDTDLAVSADDLFDLRESIPVGAPGYGGMSLQKYKNRLLVVGGEGDKILVSNQGDAESFSTVTGELSLPSENDGNQVRAAIEHYDVLYIFKAVGIYTTQDNDSGDPSSWKIVGPIEGAVGAYANAIASITQSIPGLTTISTVLLACRAGVFMFNGSVQHPSLTWKIQDIWDRITPGTEGSIQMVMDPFLERVYVLICVDGSTTTNMLLCASYRNGLNRENIFWSVFTFPYTPKSIAMLNFNDGSDFKYYLRIGMNGLIYKLTTTKGADLGSQPVNCYVQTYLFCNDSPGVLDIFRFIRFVAKGSGTLSIFLFDQDVQLLGEAQSYALTSNTSPEILREINVVSEKLCVRFAVNTAGYYFTLYSMAVLHKKWIEARPNA